jgi:hypothetical protein
MVTMSAMRHEVCATTSKKVSTYHYPLFGWGARSSSGDVRQFTFKPPMEAIYYIHTGTASRRR